MSAHESCGTADCCGKCPAAATAALNVVEARKQSDARYPSFKVASLTLSKP